MDKTISRFTSELANKYGDKPALIFGEEKLTYQELEDYSNDLMYFYMKSGVEKGMHVGVWSVNSIVWVLYYLALCKIGAVVVLLNTGLKREELIQVIQYSEIQYLFYGSGFRDMDYEECLHSIHREEIPNVKTKHYIGNGLDDVLKRCKSVEKPDTSFNKGEQILPSDPINMVFTSGTLSVPKGVITSAGQILAVAKEAAYHLRLGPESRVCTALFLFHCYGLSTSLLAPLTAGSAIYLLPYFKAVPVLECITKNKCTVFNGVPSMFFSMIKHKEQVSLPIDTLLTGIVAGSYVSPKDFLNISSIFSIPHLQMSYGQTEATSGITFTDYDDSLESKSLTIGRPIKGLELRIGDLDTGEAVGANIIGEIQIRGFNVMSGYFNLEEETEKAFTKDGWMKTGDLGFLDEKEHVHITGRMKELIIRAGENISPVEIEACIKSFDERLEVKVIGLPADVIQECVAACIQKPDHLTIDEKALILYLRKRLANYKIPEYFIYFDVFPLGNSGKIDGKEMKRIALERLKGDTSNGKVYYCK